MKNYYEILEVSENASAEIIEKAYKTLAKKYHPDIQPKDKVFWAESKFKEISEAYYILSNEKSRKNYDIKIGLNNISEPQAVNLNNEPQINTSEIDNEYQKNNKKNKPKKESHSYVKKYINSIANTIYNETQKPQDERSRDIKALILTLIIISILIFIFWKVPFLNNLIFP
ncbi:MAG: DnaJ domain-containing protein [Clostridia bacterium]|nr:DnaJ domain-containing protein [Clostridia bacterium]